MKLIRHPKQNTLSATIQAGCNTMLVGPAGSGKTTGAEIAAQEAGLDFYTISVGQQTTKADLMGYMDATGTYRPTVFRKAFEFGGVFLLDEMDAGNANVLTQLNAALANGVCSFPDGMIKKHSDFICIASANTYGLGANKKYVGRSQLDAASLDRFVVIEWGYDESMEREISPNQNWTRLVQLIRKTCDQLNIQLVVSPRASINGGKLIDSGMNVADVLEMVVWKGAIDEMTKGKILEAIHGMLVSFTEKKEEKKEEIVHKVVKAKKEKRTRRKMNLSPEERERRRLQAKENATKRWASKKAS